MVNEGDRAPDFSLESDAGKKVSLGEFRGKTVVLYFYPKDDTPGCTREAQAFSEAMDAFADAGAVVLGVSRDSVDRHLKFRNKYGLKVMLLSDPDASVHEAYGAWGEKSMYGKTVTGAIRSTFIIGPDGTVKNTFRSVKVDGHADAVLALVRGEGAASTPDEGAAAKANAAKKLAAKAQAAKKPAAKAAAAKKPAAKAPVPEKAAAKAPAAKQPALRASVATKPAAKAPVAKKPAAKAEAAKQPALRASVATKPAAKAPVATKPAAKAPVAKKPAAKKSAAKPAGGARSAAR